MCETNTPAPRLDMSLYELEHEIDRLRHAGYNREFIFAFLISTVRVYSLQLNNLLSRYTWEQLSDSEESILLPRRR